MMREWPSTVFSDCGTYRYTLFRSWYGVHESSNWPRLLGCWLNPSTANEEKDDPTTRRVMRFASANTFGHYMAINPFAFRSPKPKVMQAADDPVGPDNDFWIKRAVEWCRSQGGTVVVGWGDGGTHRGRDQEVLKLLGEPLHCFGLTKAGNPHFPTPFIQPYRLQEFRASN